MENVLFMVMTERYTLYILTCNSRSTYLVSKKVVIGVTGK